MGKFNVSFTIVLEFSSSAFLARILDSESAGTVRSDLFVILGFEIATTGSLLGCWTGIISRGKSSFISGEGIAMDCSATLGVSVFLAASIME